MTNEEDLIRCAEIKYDCWQKNLAPILNISDYLYFQTKTSIKKNFEKVLEKENAHLILFTKKFEKTSFKTIAGFAIVICQKEKTFISELYVAPEYQNQGIGKNLLYVIIQNFNNNNIYIKTIDQYRPISHILLICGFKYIWQKKEDLTYGKNKIPVMYSHYRKEKNNEGNIL